jgi:hypothetical protein
LRQWRILQVSLITFSFEQDRRGLRYSD